MASSGRSPRIAASEKIKCSWPRQMYRLKRKPIPRSAPWSMSTKRASFSRDTTQSPTSSKVGRSREVPSTRANTNGATYYFASNEDKAEFDKSPAKYAPQYGGFCANSMRKHKINDIDPNQFLIYKGKLYVCSGESGDKGIQREARSQYSGGRQKLGIVSTSKQPRIQPGIRKLIRTFRLFSLSSNRRFNSNAALINAKWVKACGKLPRCSPEGLNSSAKRPRWFA